MEKNLKAIIISVLVVMSIGAAGWCFVLYKSTLKERVLTEDNLFSEKVANKKAQEKLSRIERERDNLQDAADTLLEKAQRLEKELSDYKSGLRTLKNKISSIKAENTTVNNSIVASESKINNLKNRISYVVKDTLKKSDKLTLLDKTKDALEEKLREYIKNQPAKKAPAEKQDYQGAGPAAGQYDDTEYEAVPRTPYEYADKTDEPDKPESAVYDIKSAAIKPPEEPEEVSIEYSGEVLTINREFSFLVISLGKRDGIKEGMVFNVKRDNRKLGEIRVETVRENISAAALIDKHVISSIRAGDEVFPRYGRLNG